MMNNAAKLISVVIIVAMGLVWFIDDDLSVNFVLESSSLSATSDVYLVGSHVKLANWQPDKIKMTYIGQRQGKHRWQKQLRFSKGDILEYKFTQGSWANEGANPQGLPLENNYLTVISAQTIVTEVEHWRTTAELPVQGQITGVVKYHRQLAGEGVLPRDVIVWLPPGYQENTDQSYPVLYMHDGQNIIDPNTSSFKVDWSVDEALTLLIAENKVPAMIVVGMSSTDNRRPEYSPGVNGEAYMRFVVNKVKPLIDKTYRTKSTREHTMIGGSSMGGMISLMLLWQYDDVFSKALCMSPAFKIDDLDYVATIANYQGEKKSIKLYIDNGGLGLELRLQPGIDDMLLALKNKGHQNDILWLVDEEAKHTESAWAERFPRAIQWLTQ